MFCIWEKFPEGQSEKNTLYLASESYEIKMSETTLKLW